MMILTMNKYLENLLKGSVLSLLFIAKKVFFPGRLDHMFTLFYETVFMLERPINEGKTKMREEGRRIQIGIQKGTNRDADDGSLKQTSRFKKKLYERRK